jgi:general L-amino acid transport system substrate-binding protein
MKQSSLLAKGRVRVQTWSVDAGFGRFGMGHERVTIPRKLSQVATVSPQRPERRGLSALWAGFLAFLLLTACNAPSKDGTADRAAPKAAASQRTEPNLKTPKPGQTLKTVRERGVLLCGINTGLAGFALQDNQGAWRGFDVDYCRALAAAVLGNADKVQYVPLDTVSRLTALQSGKVDLLARNTTWTLQRDVQMDLDFAGVSYFDGQGLLAPRALNLQSAADLNGARVCVQGNTTTQKALDDYFKGRGLSYSPVLVPTEAAGRTAYQAEKCDVFSADISALAAARSLLNSPDSHVILPVGAVMQPLGPVVRGQDQQWVHIARWTLNALIMAEELGVTSKTLAQARKTSSQAEVRRLLGVEPGYGQMLGLDDGWAYRAIGQVGNYGEIFERNIGTRSPLKLERGLNALWNDARPGLLYSPPLV